MDTQLIQQLLRDRFDNPLGINTHYELKDSCEVLKAANDLIQAGTPIDPEWFMEMEDDFKSDSGYDWKYFYETWCTPDFEEEEVDPMTAFEMFHEDH